MQNIRCTDAQAAREQHQCRLGEGGRPELGSAPNESASYYSCKGSLQHDIVLLILCRCMHLHTNNDLHIQCARGWRQNYGDLHLLAFPKALQGGRPLLLGQKDQMHLYAKPPATQASHNSSMQRLLLHAQQASLAKSFLARTLAMAMNAHKPQPSIPTSLSTSLT
mgnify:FL=1